MTKVNSFKSQKTGTTFFVGQTWTDSSGLEVLIESAVMYPGMGDNGSNTEVKAKEVNSDKVHTVTFDEFALIVVNLVSDVQQPVGGLQECHLTDKGSTVAVGQRWLHHKGSEYVITEVSMDANVGTDDFRSVIISYRPVNLQGGYVWSLPVNEFLALNADGEMRFTRIASKGAGKRAIAMDRSIYHYWGIAQ